MPRPTRTRPIRGTPLLTGIGILAVVAVGAWCVRLGVPLQSGQEKLLLGHWYTWSSPSPASTRHGLVLVVALILLSVAWLAVAYVLYARPHLGRWVTRAACLWVAPFALGAPFQSRDVYAYVAQGALLRRGIDPYTRGPSALGAHDLLLQAVDPRWRSVGSPYGPVALRLAEAAAAVGGQGVGSVVALRVLAVLSVLGVVVLRRREAPPGRADLVTWLSLSPLVLVQLISAVHWEAEIALLLVTAIVLARRGHLVGSVLLALLACEVKASAAVVVAVLAVQALRHRGLASVLPLLGSVVLAGLAAVALYRSDPWGWLPNLAGTAGTWSPFAPSTTLYLVLSHLQPEQDLLTLCRALAAAAAVTAAALVLRTEDADLAARAGLLSLAAVAALPTVWPWYVAPAALLTLLSRPRLWWWGAVIAVTSSLAALPIGSEAAQLTMISAEAVALAVSLSGPLRSVWVSRSARPGQP